MPPMSNDIASSRCHTFVAGIAASGTQGKRGAAPAAKIVSLDVMDDNGVARMLDIAANYRNDYLRVLRAKGLE